MFKESNKGESEAYTILQYKCAYALELGSTQILKTVRYFIRCDSIWLTQMNTFTHPVKYSSNLSQVTSVYKQYQESDINS